MLNHPRFRQLLTGIQSYYLILFFLFPLLYAIFLVVIALPLRPFYDGNIGQIPVQLSVLLWGLLTSFLLPGLAYVILHLDKENLKKAHKNVVAQFVLKQDHTKLFNTSLFQDVNEGKSIERVEALSGGYSGAKVFAFLRPGGNVRSILKIAEIEEIENEYEKFETYIHNDRVTKMSSAPNKGIIYRWGTYGGLEYNFVGSALIDAYQPFADLYRLGIQQMVETSKLVALLHDTIFMELSKTWNWISLDRYRVYVYRHYYPFTRKFDEIRRWLHRLHQTHNPDLPQSNWDDYWNTLFNFIDLASWELRMMMESVNPRMAMVLIHGDLNSRNIIVGTKNSNPNEIHSINFIDFSHTGNHFHDFPH